MKKLHTFLCLFVSLALVLTLAACGGNDTPTTVPTTEPTTVPTTEPSTTEPPITADQVYQSVAAAMKENEATRLRMDLSFDITVTEGTGETATATEASSKILLDTMVSMEPFGSYTLMDMSVEAGEESMAYSIEVYCVEEEGSVVTYMQMLGMWMRTDSGMSPADFMKSDEMTEVNTGEIWSETMGLKDMVLAESTSQLDGKEVYVLKATVPAGNMDSVFANLGIEDTSKYQDLAMPITYYIDTETFLIHRVELNMSFMNDLLDDYLAQTLVDVNTENVTLSLNIPDVGYDLEYGTPSIPKVPQEAYDYIANNAGAYDDEPEPTVYDGPLVLNCGSEQLLLTCPEILLADYVDETNIMLHTEDYTICGDYYYVDNMIDEDVKELAQINADFLESLEALVSQGEGPAIEGYKTWQVIGVEQSYYYAWREAGDGWLLLQVYDFSGTDDATALLPQFLGYVAPYAE